MKRWNPVSFYAICLYVLLSYLHYSCTEPILGSKGMLVIFQKKGKKGQKGQNIWKFEQKYTKLENKLKKGVGPVIFSRWSKSSL